MSGELRLKKNYNEASHVMCLSAASEAGVHEGVKEVILSEPLIHELLSRGAVHRYSS